MRRLRRAVWRWRYIRERCETCGRLIRWPHTGVEITEIFDDGDPYGGSSMTATYCKPHDPRKAPA